MCVCVLYIIVLCIYCIVYIVLCILYCVYIVYCIVYYCLFFSRRLLGIVTKKDMLRHIASLKNKDPKTIRYH